MLFRSGHLSEVVGVRLSDGRTVVIKARPWSGRVAPAFEVQKHLHDAGFPCPAPRAGPAALGSMVATAEALVGPDDPPPRPVPPDAMAELLARLIDLAPDADRYPALQPAPPWVGWDHPDRRTWPPPDDLAVAMNEHPGPDWIDETAKRVRRRLVGETAAGVVGHLDWEARNLGWHDGRPTMVHDWDSLAIRPEPAIAGAAAAVFVSHGDTVAANVEQSAAFLDAYRSCRPSWPEGGDRMAWTAGLWVLTFNAKKETLGGGGGYVDQFAAELDTRLRLAGL